MANRSGDVDWTEEMIERLRMLHAAGTSYTKIAETLSAEFRVTLSKSATIGKSHRIKLEKRPHMIRPRPQPSIVPDPEPDPNPPPKVVLPWRVAKPEPLPGVRLAIWDLRRGICHFPIGERPPYAYCGERALDKPPYCQHHQRIMYGQRLGPRLPSSPI